MFITRRRLLGGVGLLLFLTAGIGLCAQGILPAATPQVAPRADASPPPSDALGRTTPFGTVRGFLASGRKGDFERAARYLNTTLRGEPAEDLARQLFVVLDRRLPATLNKINNTPAGSLADSPAPNQDLIGSIGGDTGKVDIWVERVERGRAGAVWLFSSDTLESVPYLYEQVNTELVDAALPAFLTFGVLGLPVFEWLIILFGLPLLYMLTAVPIRLLGRLANRPRLRFARATWAAEDFPERPVRLLLLAVAMSWRDFRLGASIVARQFWTDAAATLAIGATVWLLIVVIGASERYATWRWGGAHSSGKVGVLRLARWTADFIVIVAGLFVLLHHFGVNPTAAAAGLGVGGIAIALAAQKTLENVIAGTSLIFDEAVRVGEFLHAGEYAGWVEDIGLRSTRIRTEDRTLVAVPNGQIAMLSLENKSLRDKFWFHPLVRLRTETTVAQVRSVVEGVRAMLANHPAVERDSVRVRLLGFGTTSLDVDVYAFVHAAGWHDFLDLQQGLLLRTMEIVEEAGTRIAIPAQVAYLQPSPGALRLQAPDSSSGGLAV